MRDLVATPLVDPGRIAVRELGISVEVAPSCSYVRVALARCSAADTDIAVLGTSLSATPGICSGVDPVAWWIRPETWLVASTRHSRETLVEALASALTGRACAIVDVSDSFVALQISGTSARDLLARGTGFDVRSASFVPGRGTRTRFAQLAVLLRPIAADCFELIVERSAAVWLATWLRSAASKLL